MQAYGEGEVRAQIVCHEIWVVEQLS